MTGDNSISAVAVDPRLIKAIAHPLRHRILLALGEDVSSPSRISTQLGESLGRVGHHVRVLVRLGAIELVETKRRRGAVEHFYRARMQPLFFDDTWARLPRWTRRAVFAQYLARILDDVRVAAQGEGFDDAHAAVAYTLLDLDRRGYEEVAGILADALRRILEVKARSEAQTARRPDDSIRSEVALLQLQEAMRPKWGWAGSPSLAGGTELTVQLYGDSMTGPWRRGSSSTSRS